VTVPPGAAKPVGIAATLGFVCEPAMLALLALTRRFS
jgi:hypothetical protein